MSTPRSDSSATKTDPEATIATLRRPASVAQVPKQGERIGRYIVVEEIGRGAMGVVLLAYDPKLHREVALKLLRFTGDEEARHRLVREAQAMAKLNHPNVVAVYDVDVEGEHIFVAMEYVPGTTLRGWLEEQERAWPEVVAMFVGAGRGLAEAHARGLVHRDFKPSNVLVGESGRPRVTDFGLVRGELEPPSSELNSGLDSGRSGELSTGHGVVMGTPAYMAPEQSLAGDVGPASDQYAFCVALWEGLHGERPFHAKTRDYLLTLKRQREVRPPKNRGVPRKLTAAILRGLDPAPRNRWPTMVDLLDGLPRRPRRWAASVVAASVAVAAATAAVVAGGDAELCTDGDSKIAAAWSDDAQAAVEATLRGDESELAEQTWERVEGSLGELSTAWAAGYNEACRATHVDRVQSRDVLDRRVACLLRIRSRVAATVELLGAGPDPSVTRRASDLVARLPDPAQCADVERLLAAVAPPDDPAVATAVEGARSALDRVRARLSAGKPAQAQEALGEVEQLAAGIDYPPVHAEIDLIAGRVREIEGRFAESEQRLRAAFRVAVEVGDHGLASTAAAGLVTIIGTQQGRAPEGEQWIAVAEAHASRSGDPVVEGRHLSSVGTFAVARGRYEQALATFRRQLELFAGAYGGDSPRTAQAHNNVAGALSFLQRPAEAVTELEKSLAIERKVLGEAHPRVGLSLAHLGMLEHELGRNAEGVEHMRRGIAVAAGGRSSVDPAVEGLRINLANALRDAGDLGGAEQEYRRAEEMLAAFHGVDHPHVALALRGWAQLELQRGRPEQALRMLDRVLKIHDAKLGATHPDTVRTLLLIGEAALAADDLPQAREALKRAYDTAGEAELTAAERSDLEYGLARALIGDPATRDRALELARSARGRLDSPSSEIDNFLADHAG